MWRLAASIFALLMASVSLADENPPLLLHHPTINATNIVFVYAGDLWIVPRSGGVGQRLTACAGTATPCCLRRTAAVTLVFSNSLPFHATADFPWNFHCP